MELRLRIAAKPEKNEIYITVGISLSEETTQYLPKPAILEYRESPYKEWLPVPVLLP